MKDFYCLDSEDVLNLVNSSKIGLSFAEAKKRLEKNGPNVLLNEKPYSRLKVFISQFKNPLIYILILAGLASFFVGEYIDAQVIALAILINVIIGFTQENKANSALNKLKSLIEHLTPVLRDGQEIAIPTAELVVGDILILRPGQLISADARLFQNSSLETNEANLTGESIPVAKSIKPISEGTALADRNNILYI